MKQKKIIINNDIKINYIRHFICRNLKKINFIKKVEEFEIESPDESEDEFVNVYELENE
jgi:hypothetical protein